MAPKDPVMLLSFVNLKLRDYYRNLEQLCEECEELEYSAEELSAKLSQIDYHYDKEKNQFV